MLLQSFLDKINYILVDDKIKYDDYDGGYHTDSDPEEYEVVDCYCKKTLVVLKYQSEITEENFEEYCNYPKCKECQVFDEVSTSSERLELYFDKSIEVSNRVIQVVLVDDENLPIGISLSIEIKNETIIRILVIHSDESGAEKIFKVGSSDSVESVLSGILPCSVKSAVD